MTSEAKFDPSTQTAEIIQYGQRLVMREFREYFAAEGNRAAAAELKGIYQKIRLLFPELPENTVKQQMADALHAYEEAHPERCELQPSSDQFYGFSNGANRLAKYIQWVYIPAVKDASTEQVETKSSALGKLLARTVRSKISFADQIAEIRRDVSEKYLRLIEENQTSLEELSKLLSERLREYAHDDARIRLKWQASPDRAIRVDEPIAQIEAGEGGFDGELFRFGHGLQRCYLLALLQELATSGNTLGPRLVLGCDEPELHQHPPQAKHLSDVLTRLAERNSQVIVSTHSPHLISGERLTDVRLVRKDARTKSATVSHVTLEEWNQTVARVKPNKVPPQSLTTLRIRQSLLPSLNEIFFTRIVVLVESQEDIAYIATYLSLLDFWSRFKQLGCHMIPVEGKSRMLHPLAVAHHLRIPAFVIFDSDAHESSDSKRAKHEEDNAAILKLRGYEKSSPMPSETL